MFKHLFKIMWNRKRHNALIIIEITVAFMVVFALAAIGLRAAYLSHQPLGFEAKDMWYVGIYRNVMTDVGNTKQIAQALEAFPEVETAHLMKIPPFFSSRWTTGFTSEGKDLLYDVNEFEIGLAETLDMQLVQGRWFGEQDMGQSYRAIVVNRAFAETFFPNESVVGKMLVDDEASSESEQPPMKIVGVFTDFRQHGPFAAITPYAIYPLDADTSAGQIALKLNREVDQQFESKVLKLVRSMNPEWNYVVGSWEQRAESEARRIVIPMMGFAIIALFMLMMVAMGLFGVLWQNITRRTQEIGLRRALGATAGSIHWQVILEMTIICLIGVVLAMVLLVQLPLLGVFPELNWSLFAVAFAVSLGFMLLLSMSCAFYPGKMATSFQPSQALHYE